MTKYTLDEVNDMYVDVLKEIGNVGSGNAATAIANMVGTRIDMKVPNVKLMDVGKLGSAIGPEEETVIGIFLEVSHDIDGSMMFLLDLESGHYLADKLLMKENVVHEQMERGGEYYYSVLPFSTGFHDKFNDFAICSVYLCRYGGCYSECSGH